jgi:hypothetical protein
MIREGAHDDGKPEAAAVGLAGAMAELAISRQAMDAAVAHHTAALARVAKEVAAAAATAAPAVAVAQLKEIKLKGGWVEEIKERAGGRKRDSMFVKRGAGAGGADLRQRKRPSEASSESE